MLLLAVLRFFLLFRTINPRIFDQDIWDALTPAPIARPDASSPGFDWSVLRSGDFAALFDGSFFAGVLKECAANMAAAPCGLLDSLLWVAEIAKTLHFDAVAAASREARTLAFLAVENAATRTFWLLPGGDVDRILLEVELSFCAYLAGFPAGACDAEFAEVVRDTLSFCAPENVRILTGTAAFATQTLVNAKTKEPSVADEVQRRTKKYAAIVFQFPKQSSQRVALEFVAQAFPVFGKDVPFAISFLEEAVRAYLLTASSADTAEATDEEENDNDNDKAEGESGESEGNNRGSALGRRMALPPIPLDAFLQACASADATLCVYALCERFRYIGKMGKFLDCLVPLVTKFSPHKIYQYDIIAVWMAPLCALADDAWVPTQAEATRITQLAKTLRDFATDIININGFILGASGYESTFTRLRFVALSSCIFYLKLLLQKDDKKTQGNASDSDEGSDGGVYDSLLLSKVEEDHAEAMNQLVKLKATNDTADLKQFYKITKKFNDSSYTWESFKKDVTSTLCPMAPYLQNL